MFTCNAYICGVKPLKSGKCKMLIYCWCASKILEVDGLLLNI